MSSESRACLLATIASSFTVLNNTRVPSFRTTIENSWGSKFSVLISHLYLQPQWQLAANSRTIRRLRLRLCSTLTAPSTSVRKILQTPFAVRTYNLTNYYFIAEQKQRAKCSFEVTHSETYPSESSALRTKARAKFNSKTFSKLKSTPRYQWLPYTRE